MALSRSIFGVVLCYNRNNSENDLVVQPRVDLNITDEATTTVYAIGPICTMLF